MSNKTLFLTEDLYDYMQSVSMKEPEILTRLREETSHDPMHMMQISPEQGQFMSLLVRLTKASKGSVEHASHWRRIDAGSEGIKY